MMKVKLNRGPEKGKYMDMPDETQVVRVARLAPDWFDPRNYDEPTPQEHRYGTYQKSNVTLKNGASVFEWMGWIE